MGGYSLVELVMACAMAGTVAGLSAPAVVSMLDESRTEGAARYLAARFTHARAQAAATNAEVGFQFVSTDAGMVYALYVDGNGNGIRSADIRRGVDQAVGRQERLGAQFPGVEFGAFPGVPGIDGSAAPGGDPIRFGVSSIASFAPAGSASPGTIYLRGRRAQCAVRVFGDTGRIRAFRFVARTGRWSPM